IRFASLSKPAEAIPTNVLAVAPPPVAAPFALSTSPTSIGRTTPSAIVLHASLRSCETPSARARSLPRPPGSTPSTAPGTSRRARRPGAARAVAPQPDHRPARARRRHRELAAVLEIARVDASHGQAERAQLALGAGREPRRAAAAGAGVHEQADRGA